ncbi:Chitin synthase 3 [Vanrija pseudolonga]|uniref:chitin synthase n=1 Tax=Vanrija pseudolonga TaxID=143232 RepID=A0AAF1BGI6_9TREE|nr:Chitin synthase 3 [Vanrija pseudolonga]WOO78853.1 Chitin synthase 3 [Vanrija pseudolonga]
MSRPPFNSNVSFQEGGQPPRRASQQPPQRPPGPPALPSKDSFGSTSANVAQLGYEEGGYGGHPSFSQASGDVRRKKSMVRPERERIEPGHRQYHYREHANDDNVRVQASNTGNRPYAPNQSGGANLRRGRSVLGREGDVDTNESGLNLFKRGATIRRKASRAAPRPQTAAQPKPAEAKPRGCCSGIAPGPIDGWMIYCFVITCWIPNFIISKVFGKKTPEAQRAWREKMGIVAICASLMAIVGFITFGFTNVVCGPSGLRLKNGNVSSSNVIVNGYTYDLGTWHHPTIGPFNSTNSPLYMDGYMAGGRDISFLFQNVNQKCLNIITPASSTIPSQGNNMAWYFPCNIFGQNGTNAVNQSGYDSAVNCHTSQSARDQFKTLAKEKMDGRYAGVVYFSWEQVRNQTANLAVYKGSVIDMNLLQWLNKEVVRYPALFDTMKSGNSTFRGRDITALMSRAGWEDEGNCLNDVIRVGFVDSITIGCVASNIVLYVSLVFILGAVLIKFFMALYFGWFLSWRIGNFEGESYKQRMKRAEEIENWTDDIYRAAPGYLRPNAKENKKKSHFLPTQSRFTRPDTMMVPQSRPGTGYGTGSTYDVGRRQGSSVYGNKLTPGGARDTPPGSPMLRGSRSSSSLPFGRDGESMFAGDQPCPWPLNNVVPQPPADFEPFGYPLVHTLCLVTAYSESIEGLRTTLDSIATTDYPNSHKLILVVCDGMVRGSGSKQFTPDIVLSMMKELVIPESEVEAHSYVAIADGHKRHNMAKVYAGFYDYDNDTVEPSKQQRVPMVLVAKTGNPLERNDAKPGNRGKRDSQIVVMGFLQKVMFDERMTTFEYEFFNAIWRCTGVTPDRYETVLCVDADTKVFPDSVSRMNACMVNDTEIMGLCGETKIANKRETWVTMIQVFEYYISHHQTKAFESVFGGVTCLPGCFSMYRIKAPKGGSGYWVPILANPDIVEHYSENIVDTLHKKNLLLLGEDRYLSTLMLKTFPKRKMVFCPQAVCKTIVPDTFKVLLSQRRRWINSTIHNLFELMLVRDLCGTFCFSMQFVVFMDLVGTLVLPAAISFTLYILIITILPRSVTHQAKPIVSLVLLACILGLPGVLIIITSRKLVYVGWMLMYLLSLPVWNFVLPAYSFWHMDDFSWGETRKVAGEGKGDASHGDKEGTFDSSNIVMKRWIEFERERRWREGTTSRDSYYDVIQRSNSPKNSNRYSMVSTSETYQSGLYTAESNQNLRPSQSPIYGSGYVQSPSEYTPGSQHLGLPGRGEPSSSSAESARRTNRSPVDSRREPSYQGQYHDEEQPILRTSPELSYSSGDRRAQPAPAARGVSLVDPGYVPPASAADPVRRVARQQHQRRTSNGRQNVMSPTSSQSHGSSLPPGAAPARF